MDVGHGTCMVVVTEPVARLDFRHRSGHRGLLGQPCTPRTDPGFCSSLATLRTELMFKSTNVSVPIHRLFCIEILLNVLHKVLKCIKLWNYYSEVAELRRVTELKITLFRNLTFCSFGDGYKRFDGTCCHYFL
jgi:hypothetical protein